MKLLHNYILITAVGLLFCTAVLSCAQDKSVHAPQQWNFEEVSLSQLPAGWKVEATNRKGPLAAWQVVKDKSASSGEKVLALHSINHEYAGTFNLCWTNAVSFLDGEVEVRFKAVKGKEDQGGGVIWRALDKENYYIARFNPLEDNFRLYYVRGGSRKMLASAQIRLPTDKWHTLKIAQHDNHILGYLNAQKLLDVEDNTFAKAGGVGLWTKADAVTSFDDFAIRKTHALE